MISKNDINYIGEAKNLKRRVKQHSKPSTSTFYKNYLKHYKSRIDRFEISEFNIQIITTRIGRKEIEEFGIVNIPTTLNRFQKAKRDVYYGEKDLVSWHNAQNSHLELFNLAEKDLFQVKPQKWFSAKPSNEPGLYWVEHVDFGLIYIGESSNIYSRWLTHSGKTYFSALRRHIGENILSFKLKVKNGKKRYFSESEDKQVTQLLSNSTVRFFPIHFGRFEVEEHLIKKYKPLLNRKDNK